MPLVFLTFFLSLLPPILLWDESYFNSLMIAGFLRYCVLLHVTWLVNSAAHLWGDKPYDIRINPAENFFVMLFTQGEGFHNYHHTFPQDYATGELGGYYCNFTKLVIDTFAFFGLAYDLKKMNPEAVLNRRKRTGDLSDLAQMEHDDDDEDDGGDEGGSHEHAN
jgi:stearoyl-CoA desaturase (Delta-9 desaturase)